MKKKLWLAIFIGLVLGLIFVVAANADGFFPTNCRWLNECETFDTDFTVKNFKDGILVEGIIPEADLSISENPVELIITTGDVYTRCANNNGVEKVTGDLLYRSAVVPGHFSMYIPLGEGKYNITVYWGQKECANCPHAQVFPIDVKHKGCELTGDTTVTVRGNIPCLWTVPNSEFKEMGYYKQLPRVVQNAIDQGKCDITNCNGELVEFYSYHDYPFSMRKNTTCDVIPECTACP